jgi:hypothetical protein
MMKRPRTFLLFLIAAMMASLMFTPDTKNTLTALLPQVASTVGVGTWPAFRNKRETISKTASKPSVVRHWRAYRRAREFRMKPDERESVP